MSNIWFSRDGPLICDRIQLPIPLGQTDGSEAELRLLIATEPERGPPEASLESRSTMRCTNINRAVHTVVPHIDTHITPHNSQQAGHCRQRRLKGTVSRDFRLLVFFMNQFPPIPRVYHEDRFEFFRKFAEIFAAKGLPPVSTTPVANAKNLQS